jgi:riboflavin biosynthesis pyrimidine reductase
LSGGAAGYLQPVHLLSPASEPLADPLTPYASVERVPRAHGAWVMANMVVGLDGAASFGGKVGALSSDRDAQLFRRLRALADVVLVGAETVRRERYGPVRLDDDLLAERRREGRELPRIAIISRSLDLPADLPLLASADAERPPLVVTTDGADRARLSDLAVEVVPAGEARVDLPTALAELAARGMGIVLCEGGPTLLGELIAGDLLDELCLTIEPVIGGDPLALAGARTLPALHRFRLAHVAVDESTLFLRDTREVA